MISRYPQIKFIFIASKGVGFSVTSAIEWPPYSLLPLSLRRLPISDGRDRESKIQETHQDRIQTLRLLSATCPIMFAISPLLVALS